MKHSVKFFVLSIAFTLFTSLAMSARAANNTDIQSVITDDTASLSELMSQSDSSVPSDLMHAAKCLASLHLVKAGFIFGVRIGRGVVTCRLDNHAWSTPVFVNLGSGSWGFQIGIEIVDLTLVFTNHNARESFSKGNFLHETALY